MNTKIQTKQKQVNRMLNVLLCIIAMLAPVFCFAETAEQYVKQGDAAFKQGQFTMALSYYQRASQQEPLDAGHLMNIAKAYQAKGATKHLRKAVEKAISLNGNFIDALIMMAIIHEQSNEFDQALQMYEKAVAVSPANQQANRGLTGLLERMAQ